jgi:hypothetical protein
VLLEEHPLCLRQQEGHTPRSHKWRDAEPLGLACRARLIDRLHDLERECNPFDSRRLRPPRQAQETIFGVPVPEAAVVFACSFSLVAMAGKANGPGSHSDARSLFETPHQTLPSWGPQKSKHVMPLSTVVFSQLSDTFADIIPLFRMFLR